MGTGEHTPGSIDIGVYYDWLAGRVDYDVVTEAEGWGAVNDRVELALPAERRIGIRTMLDLGPGTGQTIKAVTRLINPARIVGVDASVALTRELREKTSRPDIELVHGHIEDYVDTAEEAFDLITAAGSFEFVPQLPRVLGRLATMLSRSGTMLFTYIPHPAISEATYPPGFTEYYWPQEQLEDVLASHGLRVHYSDMFTAYVRVPEEVTYHFIGAGKNG